MTSDLQALTWGGRGSCLRDETTCQQGQPLQADGRARRQQAHRLLCDCLGLQPYSMLDTFVLRQSC